MEEMEATHSGKIKETQIECEDGEATKTFEKKLHESQIHRNQEEAALHGQIVKPDNKLIEKDSDVKNNVIFYVRFKDLEKKLHLKEG